MGWERKKPQNIDIHCRSRMIAGSELCRLRWLLSGWLPSVLTNSTQQVCRMYQTVHQYIVDNRLTIPMIIIGEQVRSADSLVPANSAFFVAETPGYEAGVRMWFD